MNQQQDSHSILKAMDLCLKKELNKIFKKKVFQFFLTPVFENTNHSPHAM